jgi:lysophospholipid acyltransferase (LPLAT)-like uncharacterized protein
MKLTHPATIKSTALLGSMVIRSWFATLTPRFTIDDAASQPSTARVPTLYVFWHEMMLAPAAYFAKTRIPVLISHHRDGELIAQILRMLGGQTIRGSTNRRGAQALRQMIRRAKSSHLAITPDGPRGPRRHVQLGPIYLASRAGMQIVPIGYAFSDCWRAGSWDRMAIPKPFGIVQTVLGSPVQIPAHVSREELDRYRDQVQTSLDDCQQRAERLCERYLSRRATRSGRLTGGRQFTHQEGLEHPARPLQQILVH